VVHWLAWAHPAWMVASLAAAGLAARAGLALRRERVRGLRRSPGGRERHLRYAKPAVAMVAVGFLGGPPSMWWLRGREPFDTLHFLLGSAALALFLTTAVLGHRLERGRGRPREVHAACGAAALLLALAAAVAGFILLP